MQRGFLLPAIAFLLCLGLNFYSHHHVIISLINSFTLGLSVYLFKEYLIIRNTTFHFFFIISLSLIPLFSYAPNLTFLSFLPLIILAIFYSYMYSKSKKKILMITLILFLLTGNLYAGELIKFPSDIQYSQFIFNSPEVNYHLNRHREDALFIPYQVRLLVYSQLIYIYAHLTNFFDFLNLKNLYDVLLLANLYPLSLGIYKVFNQYNLRHFFFASSLGTLLTTGLDRSPDKLQSLYLLGPLLIFLIILGAQNFNKKLYTALLAISLVIFFSPKV